MHHSFLWYLIAFGIIFVGPVLVVRVTRWWERRNQKRRTVNRPETSGPLEQNNERIDPRDHRG